MKDRIPRKPGRYNAQVPAEDLAKLQSGNPFTITLTRNDDPEETGTPYSKATVLPDSLASAICPGVIDPTPADAFRGLNQKIDDISVIAETKRVESVEEITKNGYYNVYVDILGVDDVYPFHAVAYNEKNIHLYNNFLCRTKTMGFWGQWEWKTPPMFLGNEYRTTERYQGKPVYIKCVPIAVFPNSAILPAIVHDSKNVERVISVGGTATGADIGTWQLPLAYDGYNVEVMVNPNAIFIKTNFDASAITGSVWFKYTKTTD